MSPQLNTFYKLSLVLSLLLLAAVQSEGQEFARGADVGWLSEMEASGKRFYNDAGMEQDVLEILQDHCINSIRLRVWVDPAGGWCGKEDVVTMAKRASDMGFRVMIDFHYSDSWADPGKQFIPASWENYNLSQMTQAVYDHTFEVLTAIKNAGVTPEWVQIGNETNDGMLWDIGRASTNMANYAQFVTSGNNAAHTVFPDIITIVHVSNGYDNSLFRWNIGGLINNGAQFDAIGMSLYPEPGNWQTLTAQCLTNMNDMISRFNKPVAVTEIGMSWSSPAESKAFVEDIISKNMSLPDNMGLGVFWWEPQTYNWRGYDKGAWGTDGRPTIALDGFMTNCNQQQTDCHGDLDGTAYTDDCGRCVGGNTGLSACGPVNVTFRVDMTGQNTANGVYITGTMLDWQITPMASAGNNIYTYIFEQYPGDTGAYYYLNANDWNAREAVPAECAIYWDADRGYEVPDEDTVIRNVWSSCSQGVVTGPAMPAGMEGLTIYPNPFSSSVSIETDNSFRYEVFSITGNKVETGFCNSSCHLGAGLSKGVYLLKIYNGPVAKVVRILKD